MSEHLFSAPWTAKHYSDRSEVVKYNAHEPHEGCTGNLVVVTVDGNPDIRKALAELIARAPSMLDLLEKALPIIEEEAEERSAYPHRDENNRYWVEMRELTNEIQTEIDKARGKEAQAR
jgi:hypothetical protein